MEEKALYVVNESIPVDPDAKSCAVRKPDGTVVPLGAEQASFDDTDQPGMYELDVDGRTTPLSVDELESGGVRLEGRGETEEHEQQKLDVELENSQKIWRWLLVAALAVLVAETWLAGRLTKTRVAEDVIAA